MAPKLVHTEIEITLSDGTVQRIPATVETQRPELWTDRRKDRCRDCQGSGEYRGLNVVEPCRACNGQGWIGS